MGRTLEEEILRIKGEHQDDLEGRGLLHRIGRKIYNASRNPFLNLSLSLVTFMAYYMSIELRYGGLNLERIAQKGIDKEDPDVLVKIGQVVDRFKEGNTLVRRIVEGEDLTELNNAVVFDDKARRIVYAEELRELCQFSRGYGRIKRKPFEAGVTAAIVMGSISYIVFEYAHKMELYLRELFSPQEADIGARLEHPRQLFFEKLNPQESMYQTLEFINRASPDDSAFLIALSVQILSGLGIAGALTLGCIWWSFKSEDWRESKEYIGKKFPKLQKYITTSYKVYRERTMTSLSIH